MSAKVQRSIVGWRWVCSEHRALVSGYLLRGQAQNDADDHNRTAHEGE